MVGISDFSPLLRQQWEGESTRSGNLGAGESGGWNLMIESKYAAPDQTGPGLHISGFISFEGVRSDQIKLRD
jgi:hypothetical protein